MRIALIQRFARHDKTENIRRGLEAMSKATAEGAQVVVFARPEFDPVGKFGLNSSVVFSK